jgi:hypothetical protein
MQIAAFRDQQQRGRQGAVWIFVYFSYFSSLLCFCARMRTADFAPSERLIGQLTVFPIAFWVRKNGICVSH